MRPVNERLHDVHKIAVLRPSAVGDFVFALPALHALKHRYPEAELVLLGKAWHADFLRDFRGDTVHPSTLRLFSDLGLLDRLLARPHNKVPDISAYIGGKRIEVADFSPYGYDERQYCSPGFDLPVGCLSRSLWGTYPEYHTSADNLDFVRPASLADSLAAVLAIVDVLENDVALVNQSPKGEPQLGRRGLYGAIGGSTDPRNDEMALLWVLNLSDGGHSLLDIAERSGLPFALIVKAADMLTKHGLLGPERQRRTGPRSLVKEVL